MLFLHFIRYSLQGSNQLAEQDIRRTHNKIKVAHIAQDKHSKGLYNREPPSLLMVYYIPSVSQPFSILVVVILLSLWQI